MFDFDSIFPGTANSNQNMLYACEHFRHGYKANLFGGAFSISFFQFFPIILSHGWFLASVYDVTLYTEVH